MKRAAVKQAAALALAVACAALLAQVQTAAPAGVAVPAPTPDRGLSTPAGIAPAAPHFRVRVVDGRTGEPIASAHVQLWYDEQTGPGYTFSTDERGTGLMPQPALEPVRVLVAAPGLVDCRRPLRAGTLAGYNFAFLASTGLATENTCGNLAVRTRPGELVFYARPARWYEGLNRNAQP